MRVLLIIDIENFAPDWKNSREDFIKPRCDTLTGLRAYLAGRGLPIRGASG